VQDRLQRRVGMICTSSGCRVDTNPLTTPRNSRRRVRQDRNRLRVLVLSGIAKLYRDLRRF